ncbi:MAG TPA: cytochrome c oxidase subunit 3 [Solirubrobacterales bacterium]|nr:cytochrome c oxidase subunit 3 [Solirubrobacterales bacterium]
MSSVPRSMEAEGPGPVEVVDRERRTQASGWWGVALVIATEVTLFACLIATYFYLRFRTSEWPLGGIEKPSVTLPLLFTAMLVASSIPMFLSVRAAKGGAVRAAWWLLLLAAVVQATYLGLQIHLMVDDLNSFSPQANAYGSIYYALIATHHAHVAIGLAIDAWLLWKLAHGITNYRLIALRVAAFYWYFVSVAAIAVVLTQLYPSL